MAIVKNRLAHIWENYKGFIVGSVLAISMLWMLDIPSLFDQPDTRWNVYDINSHLSDQEAETLISDFKKAVEPAIQGNSTELHLETNLSFSLEESDLSSLDQMARFTALIAGKEIDAIVSDRDVISHYGALDGFADLEEVLSNEEYKTWEQQLVFMEDKEGEEQAMAVDISGTEYFSEEAFLAVPVKSDKKEMTVQFIRFILTETQ
ncbi:hypothetical protein [Jeotgalibaca caeni]|uniref:hypothetical protein n=1 Tax=Jeotgalibaca caeni TaxID=3028623 RepID=UPI00237E285D|nr:hypothetical protein [Jeotgalibaca caeni]MDE1549328.1 hypothetical protein [Jeotgalibaca caeni]